MNQYIQNDETEIDLLDLAKYLLRKIAWILLVGVVCAGILGAYKYFSMRSAVSDVSAFAKAETEYALNLERYELESELIDASDENTAELMGQQKEYLQDSPFMKLDPNNVWRAHAIIRVESKDKDLSSWQLSEMYMSDLMNGDYLRDIAEVRGIRISYLKEMISAYSIGTIDTIGINNNNNVLRDDLGDSKISSGVFEVVSYGKEEKEAQELMDAALEELQIIHDSYSAECPHETKVLSKACTQVTDADVQTRQKNHVTYTQTLEYQMNYNLDTAGKLSKPGEQPLPAGGISKKSLLKFGLIGFAIGAVLACVWFVFRYVVNDKLVDYNDIGRKGLILKELGTIPEQGAAMAAANIRNFAGDRKHLFLTGMSEQAAFDIACGNLKEYLSDYEFVCARDVLHDPESREKLLACDAAILVEQRSVTRYSNMKDEIIFLSNAGKEIVGVVII